MVAVFFVWAVLALFMVAIGGSWIWGAGMLALGAAMVVVTWMQAGRVARAPTTTGDPDRHPTDRQSTCIDALMTERDVPDALLDGDIPATMGEASEPIDELLDLPYRDP